MLRTYLKTLVAKRRIKLFAFIKKVLSTWVEFISNLLSTTSLRM